ncbi:MAG: type II toxin-antitoxin system VapC family toxin [Chloroflexota bacterium]
MSEQASVDSLVLVALINPLDLWHDQATKLRDALILAGFELVYFDCVVAEAISVASRRLREKNRLGEVANLFARLDSVVPPGTITWVFPDVPRLFENVLDLMRATAGELNFNDALIAITCRERGISVISSLDADFDKVAWLRRLAKAEDVPVT